MNASLARDPPSTDRAALPPPDADLAFAFAVDTPVDQDVYRVTVPTEIGSNGDGDGDGVVPGEVVGRPSSDGGPPPAPAWEEVR